MNKTVIVTAAISTALALSTVVYSQGRHDEKPHGNKPTAESTDKGAAAGGRHDSGPTTHAPAKKSATKDKSAESSSTGK